MGESFVRLQCPACGSDQTQKVSAIYAQQTQTSRSQGGGVGLAVTGDGLVPVFGGGGGASTSKTLLAQQLEPPSVSRSSGVPWWAWVVVVLGFSFYIVPGILLWVFWIPRFRQKAQALAGQAEISMEVWSRQYYCHRCDSVFDPEVV